MNAGSATLFFSACFCLAADVPVQPKEKNQAAELQGAWSLIALERDGKEEDVSNRHPPLVIKGDKVYYGGEEVARLTIDATTKPKCIDVAVLSSRIGLEGIYSVQDNTLKICINRTTDGLKERPNMFATADKPNWRILVCRRANTREATEFKGTNGFVGLQLRFDKDKNQVVITDTIEHGSAKKAGLQKDDIILKAADTPGTDLITLIRAIQKMQPGSEFIMKINRDGKEKDITVKVGILPFRFLLD
jgi:uncharacterized protein (TIGR03067 family)